MTTVKMMMMTVMIMRMKVMLVMMVMISELRAEAVEVVLLPLGRVCNPETELR